LLCFVGNNDGTAEIKQLVNDLSPCCCEVLANLIVHLQRYVAFTRRDLQGSVTEWHNTSSLLLLVYLINNTIKCRLLILFTVTLDFGLESATVVAAAAAAAAATAAARP